MIINKNTKLIVNHKTRGEFLARARRTFSTDEEAYPMVVLDPMDSKCARGEEILARADSTKIELVEDIVNELDAVPEQKPETQTDDEPEFKIEFADTTEADTPILTPHNIPEDEFTHPVAGFQFYR